MSILQTIKSVLVKPLDKKYEQLDGSNITFMPVSPVNKLNNTLEKLVVNSNTSYTINTQYDLNGETFTLPKNVTLIFKGTGSIKNGTLVGNFSSIEAHRKVFYNLNIEGTWRCAGNVGWFAEETTDINSPKDGYQGLQKALDASFTELVFPPLKFYTSQTLKLNKPKRIVMQGIRMRWPLSWDASAVNTAVLFTNKDINLLDIDVKDGYKNNTTEIIGGNFDVSKTAGYTKSAIRVLADDNQKLWGLYIKTNIIGDYNSQTGIGIDINPTEIQPTENNSTLIDENTRRPNANAAYITNVRIDSDISYMGTGIKATHWGNDKNWLTDLNIDGNIRYCPCAIDTSADCTINASIQAGKFWNTRQNNTALIYVRGIDTTAAIGSTIFDIYQATDETHDAGPYSNRYAVIVMGTNGQQDTDTVTSTSIVVPFGKFAAFLAASIYHNVAMIQGRVLDTVFRDSYYRGENTTEVSARVIRYGNSLYNQI